MDNFFGYGTSVYNVSAVSGVLATRRDTYEQLGGLNPEFRELALIEYCLRATDSGRTRRDRPRRAPPQPPAADPTDQRPPRDLATTSRRWAQTHTHDPYYNPNHRTDRGDFEPIRD